MSKHKAAKPFSKAQAAAPATNPAPAQGHGQRPANRLAAFVFLLGFLLYFQTYQYDFTLDDRIVVYENTLTTQGISAIPEIFSKPYLYGSIVPDNKLYRPMSKAIFAVCWSLSPGKPMLFHWVNIFLYALTGMLLLLTLVKYMPGRIVVPLAVSLLFVAHPVHTEVVCSVKSLDEILCLFFFLGSLNLLHAYVRTQQPLKLLAAAGLYFLAFISKESAITFLAVYPLAAFYLKAPKGSHIRIGAAMLGAMALVFGVRALVLQDTHTNPLTMADNILAGTTDLLLQKATAVYLLGKYVLLLLIPHPLVCDYSTKQIELVRAGSLPFILSFLVLIAALGYAVTQLRRRDWIAFGILFFFATISVTSNLFFLGGSHFAERFLYAPSLGFCLAAGVALDRYAGRGTPKPSTLAGEIKARPAWSIAVILLVLLYSAKVLLQGPVWQNNISLFENGVKHAPQSYRVHLSLAQDLADEKHIQSVPPAERTTVYERAIQEAKLSLSYYPDIDAYDIIGNIYYVTQRYDSALQYYLVGLKAAPDYENLNYHAGKALDKLERYREAIPYLEKALAKNPKNDGVLYNLALSHTNLNEIDKGLAYFMQVIELRPNGPDAYHYVGLIYRAKGDFANADKYLRKAQELGGPR